MSIDAKRAIRPHGKGSGTIKISKRLGFAAVGVSIATGTAVASSAHAAATALREGKT